MLEITFRDHFSVHFSNKYYGILYAFRVPIPCMIEKGSTDITNLWFQVTQWSFPVRDLVKIFGIGPNRSWIFKIYSESTNFGP